MAPTNEQRDELGRLTGIAKGAVDTAVGLGVLGLQRLQVGRVELQKRLATHEVLGPRYQGLRAQALKRAGHLDAALTEARRTVEASLHPVTNRLPGPARHMATVAQTRIGELHSKVSQRLASARHASEAEGEGPTGA
jgi:hypothetical protein